MPELDIAKSLIYCMNVHPILSPCCKRYFDDLTNTVYAGHHRPLKVWIACLYLMGLNVSNSQIAQELDLCVSDAHHMTTVLRNGVD